MAAVSWTLIPGPLPVAVLVEGPIDRKAEIPLEVCSSVAGVAVSGYNFTPISKGLPW